jgi:hypothetical protein
MKLGLLLISACAPFFCTVVALAETAPIPPNTVSCADFQRGPTGTWSIPAGTTASFDIGTAMKGMHLPGPRTISRNNFRFGTPPADLVDILDAKCGGAR